MTENKQSATLLAWRASAAELVQQIFEDTGDSLSDLMTFFGSEESATFNNAKKVEVWEKVVNKDASLSPHILQEAMIALCTIYNLEPKSDRAIRARKIIVALDC